MADEQLGEERASVTARRCALTSEHAVPRDADDETDVELDRCNQGDHPVVPEALFLVTAVAGVGVLHTIVPDHWAPIALIARQRGWSKAETARVAFKAGIGHVLSTLAIGLLVWIAGVAFATRFGGIVDTVASLALVAFGGWIAISALLEMRRSAGRGHEHGHLHGHGHSHGFSHLGGTAAGDFHGPKLQRIDTGHGAMELSIFEDGVPPRFRLKGAEARFVVVETTRPGGSRQTFQMANRGACWESVDAIPEPHGFAVTVTVDHGGHAHAYATEFAEHDHGHGRHDHDGGHGHDSQPADDPLHAPLAGGVAVLVRHCHAHRHGDASPHVHLHDHGSSDAHQIALGTDDASPLHTHMHKNSSRTALMLILGSSSMVEGVPAFFAAAKYGVGVILLMAAVFAASTIATYVLLCVYSAAGLRRVRLGAFERYGEALSGGLIALGGAAFWIWAAI